MALLVGTVFGYAFARDRSPRGPAARAILWSVAVVATHGLLDAMTDGGLGVALFWPFTHERYFLPWRPIPVAPIGLGMLSKRGICVLAFEVVASLPLLVYAFWPRRTIRPTAAAPAQT